MPPESKLPVAYSNVEMDKRLVGESQSSHCLMGKAVMIEVAKVLTNVSQTCN